MLITEFTIDHPILGRQLHDIPDIGMEWLETYSRGDGRTQMLFWVIAEDFDAVTAALESAPMVDDLRVFTELADRRLYRVDFNADGRESNLMGAFMEVGAVLHGAVGDSEGWRCRAQFPDRAAYQHVYQFCRDRDIAFRLEKVWERTTAEVTESSTLTAAQRETLRKAVENGYLDVPRRSSLTELGADLGISQSATSERFRRGVKNLVLESL